MSIKIAWVTALLILIGPMSVVSTYLTEVNPYVNSWCGHAAKLNEPGLALRCLLFASEYHGYINYRISGMFERVRTQTKDGSTEVVFTLQNDSVGLLRLMFYCKDGTLVTTQDHGNGPVFGGYEFCNNVPLEENRPISVRGSLITPSQWKPELSTPTLTFQGDLYVMELDA